MKPCSRCGTANNDDDKFCRQCGRPLIAAGPDDATVRFTGRAADYRGASRQAIPVHDLFASRDRVVIGRAADCDPCLDHPTVSRRHALLERRPEGLRLRDLGSVNGTHVAGRPVADAILLQERERVGGLGEVYDRLADREPEAWEEQFAGSDLYQEFVVRRLADGDSKVDDGKSGERRGGLGFLDPRSAIQHLRESLLTPPSASRPRRPPLWHQFRVLTVRYAELLWNDRRTLRLLFWQTPIVAPFLLLGFVGKPFQEPLPIPRRLDDSERRALQSVASLLDQARPVRELTQVEVQALRKINIPLPDGVPVNAGDVVEGLGKLDRAGVLPKLLRTDGPVVPDVEVPNPTYNYMLLFILAVSTLWFGCNNAAKEIVKEEAVYGRERAVNLGVLPYLASKVLVLGALPAVQTLVMLAVLSGSLTALHYALGHALPAAVYRLDYATMYGVLVLLALTGVALGLLLSACVSSPDRASTLLPYVLIPQMILGGGIVPVTGGLLYALAFAASPVYWAFRAVHRGSGDFPPEFPYYMQYDDRV